MTKDPQSESCDEPFEQVDGVALFRGLPVQRHLLTIADRDLEVVGVKEPADLLDQPDFAKRFIEEDRAPYGLELWPSARMLAEHLAEHECGASHTALELGCGLGLVSIATALCGWRVVASDNDPISLRFARYNAKINSAPIEGFEIVDWHKPPNDRRFDRIVAADVLYQLVDQEPILACLNSVLTPDGVAFIADPNRSVADHFEARANEHGFHVTQTRASALNHADEQVSGRIFRLQRS